MRSPMIAAAAVVLFLPAVPAHADVQATFLGKTTYTTPSDCTKLKALAAGGPRNIATVPEVLTAKGYLSWEGGCTIKSYTERRSGRLWSVSLRCSEGAVENELRTEVWRKTDDGTLRVTHGRETVDMIACTTKAVPLR